MIAYRTYENEPLDKICAEVYGPDNTESIGWVYEANPGLAAKGLLLPEGTLINLPPTKKTEKAQIQLF